MSWAAERAAAPGRCRQARVRRPLRRSSALLLATLAPTLAWSITAAAGASGSASAPSATAAVELTAARASVPAAAHAAAASASGTTLHILALGEAVDRPSDPWPTLAQELVRRGLATEVKIVPMGAAGSRLADWQPAGRAHSALLSVAAASHQPGGTRYDYVLWQSGRGDAQMSSLQYERQFMTLSNDLRHQMRFGRLLIARGGWCVSGAQADAAMLAAQAEVASRSTLGIYPGIDLRTVPGAAPATAQTQCPLDAAASAALARGWADAIETARRDAETIDRETLMKWFREMAPGH